MPKRTPAGTAKPKRAPRKPKAAAPAAESPAAAEGAVAAALAVEPTGGLLRVRQVRSGIGHAATYRRTLRALGLKHHQDVVVRPDTPSVRGMIHKVRHLVQVTPVEA